MKNVIRFLPFLLLLLAACAKEVELSVENTIAQQGMTTIPMAFDTPPDELITTPSGAVIARHDTTYVMEGDIILYREQVEKLLDPQSRSAFTTDLALRWPGNRIYYEFAHDFTKRSEVMAAIWDYERLTTLRFFPRTSTSGPHSILFCNGGGNASSYIGCNPCGPQEIYLHSSADWGAVKHEIGHAIGLFHEHTRTDRDNHIVINWDNIRPEKAYNFYTYTQSGYQGANHGQFDFGSIMLYPGTITDPNFVYDPNIPVMTEKSTGKPVIAWTLPISNGDVAGIYAMYGKYPYYITYTSSTRRVDNYSDYSIYRDFVFTSEYPASIDLRVQITYEEEWGGYGPHPTGTTEYTASFIIPAGDSRATYTLLEYFDRNNFEEVFYNKITNIAVVGMAEDAENIWKIKPGQATFSIPFATYLKNMENASK